MEKTINDLIAELQRLKPEIKDLPIKIQAPNGLLFEPKVKILMHKGETFIDKPTEMIICYE